MNKPTFLLLSSCHFLLLLGGRSFFIFPSLLAFVDLALAHILDMGLGLFGHMRVNAISLRKVGFDRPRRGNCRISIHTVANEAA